MYLLKKNCREKLKLLLSKQDAADKCGSTNFTLMFPFFQCFQVFWNICISILKSTKRIGNIGAKYV